MVSEHIHVRGTSPCCHHEKGSMEPMMRLDVQRGANISFKKAFQQHSALQVLQQRFEEFRSYSYQEREVMEERITNIECVVHQRNEKFFGENYAAKEINLFQLENNVADIERRVVSLENENRTLQTNRADTNDPHGKIVAHLDSRVASLEGEKRELQTNLGHMEDQHGKIVTLMQGTIASLEEKKRTLETKLADTEDERWKTVAHVNALVASLEEEKRTSQTNLAHMVGQHGKIVVQMQGSIASLEEENRALQTKLADHLETSGVYAGQESTIGPETEFDDWSGELHKMFD